jgi:hypothetical protein
MGWQQLVTECEVHNDKYESQGMMGRRPSEKWLLKKQT